MLPGLIQSEQKRFLIYWRKYIHCSIFTSLYKAKTLIGMLLLIGFDFEAVLEAYKFGTDFRAWFSILYKTCCNCVITIASSLISSKLKGCADKEIQ